MKGTVFDVKEFAVYDGPGVRTTVFLKGCPLRCRWCHNPEGLSPKPQLMVSVAACTHCGKCRAVCPHPEHCVACGKCIPACPQGLRRMAGQEMEPEQLAEKLKKSAVFEGGGVTFSGGEPTLQWAFVHETVKLLPQLHKAVETCGYCADSVFAQVMEDMDFILMDVKHMDPAEHKKWTGVDNGPILRHLDLLCAGDRDFIIRVPLMPGINDGRENLDRLAERLAGAKHLVRVELLPYHQTAGAKYPMAGMEYAPGFDTTREPRRDFEPFRARGIEVISLA